MVEQAMKRLTQTQLSPLEEALFQGWMKAHDMEGADESDFDFRKLYQETGGKVMPPSEMKQMVDIDSIMKAQEAHDSSSPIQQLMTSKGVTPEDPGGQGGPSY
jgi:hypothetical protein